LSKTGGGLGGAPQATLREFVLTGSLSRRVDPCDAYTQIEEVTASWIPGSPRQKVELRIPRPGPSPAKGGAPRARRPCGRSPGRRPSGRTCASPRKELRRRPRNRWRLATRAGG